MTERTHEEIIKNISDYVGKNVKKYASKPINITIG